MSIEDLLITVEVNSWVVRVRPPAGGGPSPLVVLLHGWTGDESAMWVFASNLPRKALVIAPRGLYPTPLGGYGWVAHYTGGWPTLDDLRPAERELAALLVADNFPTADLSRYHLIGFSQGAALAYAFALLNPQRVASLAGLSGFLPLGGEGLIQDHLLEDKPVFIAHGSLDDLVPIARARQAVGAFERAGARVTYCEDQVGHKLSANCFRGLQAFYTRQIS